ncbi:MAG: (Fe-S)-binding protein [Planctomycetes bacterium]|nr:(Fe-S)-binding protein [Planctomycetota bacterium]
MAAALGALTLILNRRLALLRAAAAEPRTGDWGARLKRLLVIGFGQSRQPRYLVAGLVHVVLFAGFMLLSLRSMSLIAEPFWPGISNIGEPYTFIRHMAAALVLVGCAIAAWRRVVVRPARYHDRHATVSHTKEAVAILSLISFLMIADAAFDFGGSEGVRKVAFWAHNSALLFFLCLLPYGKHFHVITALPNVFFSSLKLSGVVKPPSYSESDFDALETVGVSKLEDFTWKQLLDVYSCVDCGRCSDHCPAYASKSPLSPRMLNIKTRDAAFEHYPIKGEITPPEKRADLVGEVITPDELWSCTTCGACQEACPVTIEYLDRIVDMRRFLVDDGNLPATLQKPMAALEKRGNPYGKMARKRGDTGVRVLKEGDACDTLFFTDSCAAFDPRVQETAIAFGEILAQAGVDAGTLGKDEVDSGHEARRFGEEGLFLTLREQNLEAMDKREFTQIVTTDPHALNALKNDYELEQPVLHHSQYLAKLLSEGKLPLQPLGDNRRYTFHDPCYLGRHNNEYAAPRDVLNAIPGIETVEMERSRNRSFCCGGGSLNLFHETECERRMGELRLDMVAESGADVVVTACPFCLSNLEDAAKTTGRENEIEIIDLAELVQRSLGKTKQPEKE